MHLQTTRPHTIRENEKREEEQELIERVASTGLDDSVSSAALAAAASAASGNFLTRQWRQVCNCALGVLHAERGKCSRRCRRSSGPYSTPV